MGYAAVVPFESVEPVDGIRGGDAGLATDGEGSEASVGGDESRGHFSAALGSGAQI